MSPVRRATVRGAAIGAGLTLPMGIIAGSWLKDVLFQGAVSGNQGIAFTVMVTVAFIAWGVFIGGMLGAQKQDNR